jgi:UDP-N-acetylglucosamine 4,6-dehydratase
MATVDWSQQSVLVTGGTGSFGRRLTEVLLQQQVGKLIVFSRDEHKQHEMRSAGIQAPQLRYFLGDVRDVDRLRRAMQGVTVVVHAAALKHVEACEYNPHEAVLTNIMGARNVIEAALDRGVQRVLALSTDKAASPVNLYGATKLVAEKLFVQANSYRGAGPTRFACVRYGNVVGSRGSVAPLFLAQRASGRLTVTDRRMTRFWLTLDQGVRFVVQSIESLRGGEIFVPKIPSLGIVDLARAIAPECQIDEIGMRPGEKLHEVLISEDEARLTREFDDSYIIEPAHPWWTTDEAPRGQPLAEGARYRSDENPQRLSLEAIGQMLSEAERGSAVPSPTAANGSWIMQGRWNSATRPATTWQWEALS